MCGELIEHHLDEPFASCRCGTSEWYEFTPHMQFQSYVNERNKIITPLIMENNLLKTKLQALETLHQNYRAAIRKHLGVE